MDVPLYGFRNAVIGIVHAVLRVVAVWEWRVVIVESVIVVWVIVSFIIAVCVWFVIIM